jgi:acyl-CoA oxidase
LPAHTSGACPPRPPNLWTHAPRIGGSGQHGKLCVVFAQLTVAGKWEGPHVFAVRIRDDRGAVMPGVRIKDMGPKMGLNGVDNGQMWFDHVRVPR